MLEHMFVLYPCEGLSAIETPGKHWEVHAHGVAQGTGPRSHPTARLAEPSGHADRIARHRVIDVGEARWTSERALGRRSIPILVAHLVDVRHEAHRIRSFGPLARTVSSIQAATSAVAEYSPVFDERQLLEDACSDSRR